MAKERHVLVILPHPDDETFQAGTLAMHINQGTPVTYVCLTLGEMGRNMGKPIIANRVTLPQIRRKELAESCRSIGITDCRMWGFHDRMVEFEDQEQFISRISETIEELNPSLIITFYPGYAVHPDHDACGAAVVEAVRRMPADERPKVHCVAFSADCEKVLGKPDVINHVEAYYDIKKRSFNAHQSQFQFVVGTGAVSEKELRQRWAVERYWTYHF